MARWKWFLTDVAAILLIWSAVSLWVPGADQVLPAPPVVMTEMLHLAQSGALFRDIGATVVRVFEGFLLAVTTGIPLGLLFGLLPRLFRFVEPLIEVVRPIAPIAWIPLSILWLGIGEPSKIFIIWLISFFFVLLSTVTGVTGVSYRLIEAARTLGARPFFILRKIVFPAALPTIFLGLRLGLRCLHWRGGDRGNDGGKCRSRLSDGASPRCPESSSGNRRYDHDRRAWLHCKPGFAARGTSAPAVSGVGSLQRDFDMKLELGITDSSLIDPPPSRLSGIAPYLVGFGGVVGIWYIAAKLVGSSTFLPGPELVAKTLADLAESGVLFPNVVASLVRVLVGFSIGATAGILLGIVIGLFPRAERAVEPIVELARSIPPYAMISFAILAFGTGPEGKFIVLAYATFFPVLISTINGLSSVPPRLVEAAFTLGASRLFTIGRVMLPAATPQIMVGLRLGFGLAWLSLIAAEMVAASEGLGFMIADGRELLQTQIVMAGMVVIGVLGYLFNRLFVFAEHKLRAHEL